LSSLIGIMWRKLRNLSTAAMRHYETVKSRDGTSIVYERRGHGPPLLMVHGASVDHTRWGGVAGALAEHFTLLLMDRRGRGRSGDGPVYAIEREFEDVAAVLEASPRPARVLAHSYGAICSLGAARRTTHIERMALYEPPLPVPGESLSFTAELSRRLAALLATGERALVVETFLREVLDMSPAEIGRLRRTSGWPVRLAAAATLPREVGVAATYRFVPEDFAQVRVPALFLHGDRSPAAMQASTRMTAAAIAGSRVEILSGQSHGAMSFAPTMFLAKVLPFLCGKRP
jgi:pimeloyl-ACP methyl ester carboxylesterase